MKKIMNLVLAAILICGLNVFTSCDSDNNHARPSYNLAEKLIGKWMDVEFDGQPALTSDKSVVTFVSPTKAIYSISRTDFTETQVKWAVYRECDVEISDNKVTLTGHPEGNPSITLQEEYIISSITDTEMVCIYRHTTFHDGQSRGSVDEKNVRMKKIGTDYRADIIGLWECEGISGGDTYNDANARLEFFDDGTYNFYRKNDAGYWESVTSREFQIYFVDGTLMATRWKDQGEDEHRECWEIKTLSGDEMVWTALRQNTDGSTFQQDVKWKKIDLKVAEKILGKWILAGIDGQASPTNMKSVFTFVSTTKAYVSASLNNRPDVGTPWDEETEADVVIDGNKINLTLHNNVHTTTLEELIVTDINDSEFSTNFKVNKYVDGNLVHSDEHVFHYVKAPTDYREAIVGTWEGRCTSEGSVFDDGQEHRWQYKADGTYVYYVKDGNNWVPYATNTLNEYFVDGNLLCTRWIDNGVENREWWEINIDGDKMNWTALRQKEDGTTFTATFEMKKVE